jgi:hydrogenase nickel incorporation protein HypA/HybF
MHEMSIVEALIEGIETELRSQPASRLAAVRVRVGELRLVVPETMRFCYEAATAGTSLAGSVLEIEEIEARARCRGCGEEFAVEDNWFACPCCAGVDTEIVAGRELEMASLELDVERGRAPVTV